VYRRRGRPSLWAVSLKAEAILKKVAKYFGIKPMEMLDRSNQNNVARCCAMVLCWNLSGMSHRENVGPVWKTEQ